MLTVGVLKVVVHEGSGREQEVIRSARELKCQYVSVVIQRMTVAIRYVSNDGTWTAGTMDFMYYLHSHRDKQASLLA